jgi:hypothetical protein
MPREDPVVAETNDLQAVSTPSLTRVRRIWRALWRFLVDIISSPKGDHGGWDGGARGL